jgi:hypothetical protein
MDTNIKHDDQDLKYLIKRGEHIRGILVKLRQWFIKNPYPIEYRKIAYTYGAGAKKYGGINSIVAELEAEGLIEMSTIETAHGLVQTFILTEFQKGRIRA